MTSTAIKYNPEFRILASGIGYQHSLCLKKRLNNSGTKYTRKIRVIMLGDDDAGKTSFASLGLDRYKNKESFTQKIGLVEGSYTNVMFTRSHSSAHTHEGSYLHSAYGEGKYTFQYMDCSRKRKKPLSDKDYSFLDMHIVEIGEGIFNRMRTHEKELKNNGDSLMEKIIAIEDAKGQRFIEIIKKMTQDDIILDFINLSTLNYDNLVETKDRIKVLTERTNFLRSLNPRVRIKHILNRIDELGCGSLSDCIDLLVQTITSNEAFSIDARFFDPDDSKYAPLISITLRNAFRSAMAKFGVEVNETDFLITHILRNIGFIQNIHVKDVIKIYEAITSEFCQREENT